MDRFAGSIPAGKQDHISGYREQWDVLENYARATFVVLDREGHKLHIGQEALYNALVDEWLDREVHRMQMCGAAPFTYWRQAQWAR